MADKPTDSIQQQSPIVADTAGSGDTASSSTATSLAVAKAPATSDPTPPILAVPPKTAAPFSGQQQGSTPSPTQNSTAQQPKKNPQVGSTSQPMIQSVVTAAEKISNSFTEKSEAAAASEQEKPEITTSTTTASRNPKSALSVPKTLFLTNNNNNNSTTVSAGGASDTLPESTTEKGPPAPAIQPKIPSTNSGTDSISTTTMATPSSTPKVSQNFRGSTVAPMEVETAATSTMNIGEKEGDKGTRQAPAQPTCATANVADETRPQQQHPINVDSPSKNKDNQKEEDNNEEEEDDYFSSLAKRTVKAKRRKKRTNAKKRMNIHIEGVDKGRAEAESMKKPKKMDHEIGPDAPKGDISSMQWEEDENDVGRAGGGAEDWQAFYAETHEDQDPAFIARERQRREKELHAKLAAVDKKDMDMRQEIDKVVAELLKEKQANVDRGIDAYRVRVQQEERKVTIRLQERYRERKASNEQKINQRVKQLQQDQQKQINMALQQHRQHVQQHRIPQAMGNQQWEMTSQQLQLKHQQQHQELTMRTEEYKRKTDMEFKQEQEKIRKVHEQKQADLAAKRSSITSELIKQFTASRQRYLKRHLQRVLKEKDALGKDMQDDKDGSNEENIVEAPPKKAAKTNTSKVDEGKSVRDLAKSAVENKKELRAPSPFRSTPSWLPPDRESTVGAATRYKHRKGVLSATQIHPMLSIEIHNEGLWILQIVDRSSSSSSARSPTSSSSTNPNSPNVGNNQGSDDPSSSGSNKGEKSIEPEFLPWGLKAFDFLESVVNGEIPLSALGKGRRLDFGDSNLMMQTSGQIFCSITDLRTSEETAHIQRAAAMKEHHASTLACLEKKAVELTALTTENEKAAVKMDMEEKQFSVAVDAAVKDQDKARKVKEDFLKRYQKYFGPDGNILQTVPPKDRQDIENKFMRFKTGLANADEKVKMAKERHAEKKQKLQKMLASIKSVQHNSAVIASMVKKRKAMATDLNGDLPQQVGQAESDRVATKVKDVIGCLDKVAEKRREQHNLKKSGHITSNWLSSHPDLPSSLKKSVWRRMHRRKLQVVLRPTMATLCKEIRNKAAVHADNSNTSSAEKQKKQEEKEERMLKAEQALVLACHPLSDPSALSVPSSRSTDVWGEPGWRLDLSVPVDHEHHSCILPRAQSFPVLEKNQLEICSIPGRQAASFLSATHLRCLASPLSTFSTMSSPAEIPSALQNEVEQRVKQDDPLHISGDSMRRGYNFSLNPVASAQSSTVRKKSSNKEETEKAPNKATNPSKPLASTKASTSKKAASSKASAAAEKPMASSSERSEKKRRNSKSESSPRKRKKAEPTQPPKSTPKSVEKTATASVVNVPQTAARKHSEPTLPPPKSTPKTAEKPTIPASAVKVPQTAARKQTSATRTKQQTQPQTPQQKQQPPLPPNPIQQQNYQHQQQMLRMMQQAHQGQVPPGYQPPPAMQQMQQFYAPLNHPNTPSPRSGQAYHPQLSPGVARMQVAGSRPPVSIPMHQGIPMPGNAPMGARPMGASPPNQQPIAGIPPPGTATQQARGRQSVQGGSQQPIQQQKRPQPQQNQPTNPKQTPQQLQQQQMLPSQPQMSARLPQPQTPAQPQPPQQQQQQQQPQQQQQQQQPQMPAQQPQPQLPPQQHVPLQQHPHQAPAQQQQKSG